MRPHTLVITGATGGVAANLGGCTAVRPMVRLR